jgi:ribonuclease HI
MCGVSSRQKQIYVVVRGRKPGIYTHWSGPGGAEEQVRGFGGAQFKSFYDRAEAFAWLRNLEQNLPPELADLVQQEPLPVAEALDPECVWMYTDGCALNNPGPGGYGVVMLYRGHRKELSGGFAWTTNNRMEIMACIVGLQALKQPMGVILFSDSRYVVDTMTKGGALRWRDQGWMRTTDQRAENADLWQTLLELCEQHTVEFRWVRGHSSTPENERCDQLADQAARQPDLPPDPGYAPTLF